MNKNTKIKVRNRSTGSVGYRIPDMGNLSRKFAAREAKEITFDELQKVSFIPGGSYLLQHYLVIENLEARNEILGQVELEYDYNEEDIKNLLLNGSLDQLLDCLDFAPQGVIELIQKFAVSLEINDIRKRQAILKSTGFNVDKAIQINFETNEEVAEEASTSRRVAAPSNETSAPIRRTVTKKE